MKNSTRRLASAALIGVLALGGVACGGDDDAATDTDTTEETESPMEEST